MTLALIVVGLRVQDAAIGPGTVEKPEKRAALAALDLLHQRLANGQSELIWETASQEQRAQSRAELVAVVNGTRERLGEFVGSKVVSATCPDGEVRLNAQLQFERGVASEAVVWEVRQGALRLVRLQIVPGPANPLQDAKDDCRTPAS